MIQTTNRRAHRFTAWLMIAALLAMPLTALSQTRIEVPKNKYSVSDDVKLGQQAVQQVEQQMPILRDGTIDNYIESVGRRLVNAIPSEFRQPEFRYTFDVVNARDINAFALPGGPMYVNRGMIEAARTEGEMAGVMAHEISHVALRHATAQATETQKFQIGSVLGQIAGAVIGGVPGAVIGTASQIGFGAGALKYSRKYETQSDILGAQIMARAGYDPRDLANMFRTIERQGGGRSGPEWLSSHPNPGNRYQRINQEAALLRVSNPVGNSREFTQVQARLRNMGRAPSMEEIARGGQRNPSGGGGNNDTRYPQTSGNVDLPSTRYRSYNGGNLFQVNVPDNWRDLPSNSSVTFSPEGAYGDAGGQFIFTHGVMIGVENAQSNNLRQATDDYIRALLQGNQHLRAQTRNYQQGVIDRRTALAMTFAGRSPNTGRTEVATVYTTLLRDGTLFYMISVAPQEDYRRYQNTFNTMLRSVRLNG